MNEMTKLADDIDREVQRITSEKGRPVVSTTEDRAATREKAEAHLRAIRAKVLEAFVEHVVKLEGRPVFGEGEVKRLDEAWRQVLGTR